MGSRYNPTDYDQFDEASSALTTLEALYKAVTKAFIPSRISAELAFSIADLLVWPSSRVHCLLRTSLHWLDLTKAYLSSALTSRLYDAIPCLTSKPHYRGDHSPHRSQVRSGHNSIELCRYVRRHSQYLPLGKYTLRFRGWMQDRQPQSRLVTHRITLYLALATITAHEFRHISSQNCERRLIEVRPLVAWANHANSS